MLRVKTYMILLILCIAGLVLDHKNSILSTVLSGLAIGFVIPLVDATLSNIKTLGFVYQGWRHSKSRIRISASYLYRIKVDDEYLLVKGSRFDHFQPVGGVYKYYPSAAGELQKLEVLDDDLLVPDAVSLHDLRIRIPGRSLHDFVSWFEKQQGREVDGWREFYEELIASNILPAQEFDYISYE